MGHPHHASICYRHTVSSRSGGTGARRPKHQRRAMGQSNRQGWHESSGATGEKLVMLADGRVVSAARASYSPGAAISEGALLGLVCRRACVLFLFLSPQRLPVLAMLRQFQNRLLVTGGCLVSQFGRLARARSRYSATLMVRSPEQGVRNLLSPPWHRGFRR